MIGWAVFKQSGEMDINTVSMSPRRSMEIFLYQAMGMMADDSATDGDISIVFHGFGADVAQVAISRIRNEGAIN